MENITEPSSFAIDSKQDQAVVAPVGFRAQAPPHLARSSSTPPADDCRNLFVGDLTKFCTEDDICELFSKWGKVRI